MSATEKNTTHGNGGSRVTTKNSPTRPKARATATTPRRSGTTAKAASSTRKAAGTTNSRTAKQPAGFLGQSRRSVERAALISLGASQKASQFLRAGINLDRFEKDGRKTLRSLEREISARKGQAAKQLKTRGKWLERFWTDNRKAAQSELTNFERSFDKTREQMGAQVKNASQVVRFGVDRARQVVSR